MSERKGEKDAENKLGPLTMLPTQHMLSTLFSCLLPPSYFKGLKIEVSRVLRPLSPILIVMESDFPWLMHALLPAKYLSTTPWTSCLPLTCFAWPEFLNWNSIAGSFGTCMFTGAHPKAIMFEIIPPWLYIPLALSKVQFLIWATADPLAAGTGTLVPVS